METSDLFLRLGLAVLLGLLVGLQREWAASKAAGVRTFALITLLGALAGALTPKFGGIVLAGAFVALAGLMIAANAMRKENDRTHGLTTEIAALVMMGVGAALMLLPPSVAVAAGAVTAILLHLKPELHDMVSRLERKDTHAIMRFALLSAVILPVLPDETYGPYDVLNPFNIWLMVVLIVGLNLFGYLLAKFVKQRGGALLTGALGGAVSSTATTFAFTRQSSGSGAGLARASAVVIGVASTVVYARAAVEMAAVSREMLMACAFPLIVMTIATGGPSLVIALRGGRSPSAPAPASNPAEILPALVFAAIYAGVLVISAAAREHVGPEALYPVAAISGVADMDAITLSTSRLVGRGALPAEEGWRLIVIAVMSNVVFKAAVIAVVGSRALLARVGAIFLVTLLAGALLLVFGQPFDVGGAPGSE